MVNIKRLRLGRFRSGSDPEIDVKGGKKKPSKKVRRESAISAAKVNQKKQAAARKTKVNKETSNPSNLSPTNSQKRRIPKSDSSVRSGRSVQKVLGLRPQRPSLKKVQTHVRFSEDDKSYFTFNTVRCKLNKTDVLFQAICMLTSVHVMFFPIAPREPEASLSETARRETVKSWRLDKLL